MESLGICRDFFLAFVAVVSVPYLAAETMPASMDRKHFGFFEKYCLNCHDDLTEKGSVNLEDLPFTLDTIESADRWKKVLNSLNSGEMPPEEKKQPSSKEKEVFLADLSDAMDLARRQLSDSGGDAALRRLNRREYENTIFDLLGVEIDTSGLPNDSTSRGFDTDGASLFLSPDQIEQYLVIAKQALTDVLLYEVPEEPVTIRVEPEVETNERVAALLRNVTRNYKKFRGWKASKGKLSPADFGVTDEQEITFYETVWNRNAPTYASYLSNPGIKTRVLLTSFEPSHAAWLAIPDDAPPGRYTLRVNAGVLDRGNPDRRYLEYGLLGDRIESAMKLEGAAKVTPEGDAFGKILNLEVAVPPIRRDENGTIIRRTAPSPFMPDEQRIVGVRERQSNSRPQILIANAHRLSDKGFGIEPTLYIDWLEITGPYRDAEKIRAAKLLLSGFGDEEIDANVEKILRAFADRAHRGKAPDNSTMKHLVSRFQSQREMKKGPRESLIDPLSVLLTMPSFLYLKDNDSDPGESTLTDRELAVRLAYFLHGSAPDRALLKAAREGRLKNEAGLNEEVSRLVGNPKSMRFVEGFVHQWLQMERLDFFQFNYRMHPDFVDTTRESARQEVYETFHYQLQNNLPLSDLLKADYLVINDILGDYYGIEEVVGSNFRPVSLLPDSPRGGLLGMAAVHAMGSDGEHSSLVERGTWVLKKLLNRPPPPAPPNVPQLSRHSDELLPARELLAVHMEDAQCAQCHNRIDPVGYGLENFDAAGLWRDREKVELVKNTRVFKTEEFPILADGRLPLGQKFNSYFEMREVIAEEYRKDFVSGFLKHLIAYSLGRSFSFTDEAWLDDLASKTQSNGWRVQDLIRAMILSEQFRT